MIRVLVHYYADEEHDPQHTYLGDATKLTADLQAAQ